MYIIPLTSPVHLQMIFFWNYKLTHQVNPPVWLKWCLSEIHKLSLFLRKILKFSKSCLIPFSECWCCTCVSVKQNASLFISLAFSNKTVIVPYVTHFFSIFSKILFWRRHSTSAEQKQSPWSFKFSHARKFIITWNST